MSKYINKLLSIVEMFIFGIRWIQAPIYLLLSLVLFGFIYEIYHELYHLFTSFKSFNEDQLIILALTLCDVVLVANLVVIVVISGYENFVSKMNLEKKDGGQPVWIKKLSPNAVKLKIAGSIIGISSISLLKKFLEVSQTSNRDLAWSAAIHIVFVVSALLIAFTSYIEGKSHKASYDDDH
ncbi:TIGR00645 family protein [Francisella sp. 19X1-34]|uniref:TIGR00645 family protein n=1 Tax=Francisella sp. 19X1-34 TaxID=3087177 RepID=UPI002E2F4403|nr:TIGR00645 family protein [Francisella sp. 19X1-34]MED7788484.1 TIGR00645 family protein [Francisella sp. 19X1-34]